MNTTGLRLLIAACIAAWCGGCAQIALFAANVPASFGSHTRLTDLSYGADSRNKLDVYLPDKSSMERAPVPLVVFIHGGGWNSGDKSYYKFIGAALAAQGYVAVLPNYRLYPQVKSTAMFEDAAAAVAFAHNHAAEWGADAAQLYLVGHSAGAHLAMMVVLNKVYLHQAGLSPKDVRGVVGLAGPYDFIPFSRDYMNDLFGPPENFAASQPINFVRNDAPPLLLMHGLKDHTVNPNNTRNLTAALQAIGGRVRVEYFPDADHGDLLAAFSSLTRHRLPVLQEINNFISGGGAAVAQ